MSKEEQDKLPFNFNYELNKKMYELYSFLKPLGFKDIQSDVYIKWYQRNTGNPSDIFHDKDNIVLEGQGEGLILVKIHSSSYVKLHMEKLYEIDTGPTYIEGQLNEMISDIMNFVKKNIK
jgi:hypothetical protein